MLGAKAPNFDTYGLFRATHSHNPSHYSHIAGLKFPCMLLWGGVKDFHQLMSRLMWIHTFSLWYQYIAKAKKRTSRKIRLISESCRVVRGSIMDSELTLEFFC